MKKFLGILIVLAISIIVVVIMMKPSKEDVVKDEQEQEIVKDEVDSSASEKLDDLDALFDEELEEGIEPDTLGK